MNRRRQRYFDTRPRWDDPGLTMRIGRRNYTSEELTRTCAQRMHTVDAKLWDMDTSYHWAERAKLARQALAELRDIAITDRQSAMLAKAKAARALKSGWISRAESKRIVGVANAVLAKEKKHPRTRVRRKAS